MRKLFYASILFLITHFCFSQNVNFIIQVNDRLLNNGEIANLYLTTGKENDAKKYYVNYYPGDLILNEEVLSEINLDTLKKFYLHFDYTDQQNHRTFYYKKLREFWGINYEDKGKELDFCKTIYSKLQDSNCSQHEAIKRAEKLFNSKIHDSPCDQNPVTTVFELVRELNRYLKQ